MIQVQNLRRRDTVSPRVDRNSLKWSYDWLSLVGHAATNTGGNQSLDLQPCQNYTKQERGDSRMEGAGSKQNTNISTVRPTREWDPQLAGTISSTHKKMHEQQSSGNIGLKGAEVGLQ